MHNGQHIRKAPSLTEWCFSIAYGNISFPVLRRGRSANPLVVYYHIVNDSEVPHVSHLYSFRSVAEFKKDLEVLLGSWHPISLQEFIAAWRSGTALKGRSFLLTFDDGFRECFDIIAPVLQRAGVPGTFFICSAFLDNKELSYDGKKSLLVQALMDRSLGMKGQQEINGRLEAAGICRSDLRSAILAVDYARRDVLDRIAPFFDVDFSQYLKQAEPYLTSQQVAGLLKDGHAVGGHSIDHPRYEDISLDEQVRQTRDSVECVKAGFDLDYGAFAFPHSDANVSTRFFERVSAEIPGLDVCFGNRGLMVDRVPAMVQRVAMEKTWMPGEAILGRELARRCAKSVLRQHVVSRP
jgi:peptidoglycan/xylan/chitin deacetylase (PgdA/CDA1 family)